MSKKEGNTNIVDIVRYLSPKGFSEMQWYAVVISVVFVMLLGWVAIMDLLGFSVSFRNICFIHRYFFVWLFNAMSLIVPLSYLCIVNFKRLNLSKLNKQIANLSNQIDKSILLAGKIGSGQDLDLTINENSELQKTLMNLGKSLKVTREREEQFSWVSKGKEKISDIMRLHNKIEDLSENVLEGVVSYYGAVQGAFYLLHGQSLDLVTQYAYGRRRYEKNSIPMGKGLIGAAAYERQLIYRTEIPDDYFTITSGLLGDQRPQSLLIIPLLQENETQGVLELSFLRTKLPQYYLSLAEELCSIIGGTIYNLNISAKTERLLWESQQMTATLRKNEEQLHQNAQEMLDAQAELEKSNKLLATKIQEVENGQKKLEVLLTNASEFISIYNENKDLLFESPSIRRILGYDPGDEVHGMDIEMMTPKGYRNICAMFDYLLATPGGEAMEQYTYLKKNGEKIFLETQGKNLLHDPAIRGLIFNTRDITERKRAEREERMKSRMQSLSENSPDMIIRTNTIGKMVYVNPAASRFMHMPTSELMKMKITEVDIDKNFTEYVGSTLKEIKRTRQHMISEIEVEVDGELRIVEVKAIPELAESDELESILFAVHDVTEFKRIEQDIKDKNKKIQDSINYAKRIQTAILPDTNVLQQYFPRSFMFYRPKDVVSGDFPWMFHFDNICYIAAVDCTGHGVPGALLSFIGYFLLNNITDAGRDLPASEVLDRLHSAVRTTLRQDQDGANGRDGMDLGLCRIDRDKQEIQFAGAHRPLYYMRGSEFTEYKGTRKGIGGIPLAKKPENNFENNIIKYEQGDRFFVFSDGLPDQLGGGPGVKKKYQTKKFRELLERTSSESMSAISQEVVKDFYDWVGDEKQVDDVLLIGIEL